MYIRHATSHDKDAILKLSHQHSHQLGYVHPVALMSRIEQRTVFVAVQDTEVVGFVDYYEPQRGENSGYSVIYHLAVLRQYQRQGIGRALLFAVPCPIRLKCTEDNDQANTFYQRSGMIKNKTIAGRKRNLNVWQLNVLFIQVAGDNSGYALAARQAGVAYGCRHDDPPKAYPFMFDIKWDDYDWQEYLALLSRHRPVLALVADYEVVSNRRLMYQQLRDLYKLGVPRICVCPKFDGAVKHIPSWCVIAISVPTSYAGFVASDLTEYRGRKIHLLGGNPEKQRDLMVRLSGIGAQVISMDGNLHTHRVKSDQVFTDGRFRKLKPHEKVSYYQQIAMSGRSIMDFMNKAATWRQLELM